MPVAPGMFQRMPDGFESLTNDGFAAGFDGAGADEHAVFAEVGVAHPVGVGFEVGQRFRGVAVQGAVG